MASLGDREKVEILRSVTLLAGWSEADLLALAPHVREAERPAGAVLTMEGRAGGELFMIVEGEAEASLDGETVGRLGAGAFCGEMYLLDRSLCVATIVAATSMRLLVLDHPGFVDLVLATPGVAFQLIGGLARRRRQRGSLPDVSRCVPLPAAPAPGLDVRSFPADEGVEPVPRAHACLVG